MFWKDFSLQVNIMQELVPLNWIETAFLLNLKHV